MREGALHVEGGILLLDQAEIDLAGLDVGAHDLDAHASTQAMPVLASMPDSGCSPSMSAAMTQMFCSFKSSMVRARLVTMM
ncbi:MAG: hypothetical protein A2199_05580 [Hydrogenophilales bacterium RIFOXYA1_FULL_63_33]|nr:MAG: hypothetical protein A2199_05580 [Hydrogenophilales bacterium RIFOXYA1_FULL_63_33]